MSEGDDATLPDTRDSQVVTDRRAKIAVDERYEVGDVLGRGGMGEVRLARDTRIHRDVAVKLLRDDLRDDATLARFFREARIQGVLEHPAVVPVHDLGLDGDGNPYFVMKRLAGITLADVLRSEDPVVRARWPRRQLLTRLIDVCRAVELAHTRGVIHRDLKPANIMLGDFGEAYVLDWGLARLSDETDAFPQVLPLSGDDSGQTAAGAMLGTPGYMSPEQARGEAVGRETDVFALGCVLYEILAGVCALPRGMAGIAATLSTSCHRPSTQIADAPLELDDLCARATDAAPGARPDVRAFADAIQAYLDGDRDLARRRDLAQTHATLASKALSAHGDDGRADAMREAGRALALDPENEDAQRIVGQLMFELPSGIPAEALAAADAERGVIRQSMMRWGSRGFLGLFVMSASMLVLPVHTRWPVVVAVAVAGATWLVMKRGARRPLPMRSPLYFVLIGMGALMLTAAGLLFGPLLIMPIFAVGAIAGYLSIPARYPSYVVLVGFLAPMVALIGLELAGVLPPSFEFIDGALVLRAWIVDLTPGTTFVVLGLSIVVQIVNTSFIAISGKRVQEQAQDAVHVQRWHLQQLLPRARPDDDRP